MDILLIIAVVFAILLASEVLWRKNLLRGESGRKFVHIAVGSFVAFTPFFASWRSIQLVSLVFLAGVILSRRFGAFRAIHNIDRKGLGEILFPVGVGLAATLTTSMLLFAIAILHLALADGLAAIIGTKFGKKNSYTIFGERRTLIGTFTFYIISVLLLGALTVFDQAGFVHVTGPIIVLVPLMLTLAENLAVVGTDNIVVPTTVLAALGLVQLF